MSAWQGPAGSPPAAAGGPGSGTAAAGGPAWPAAAALLVGVLGRLPALGAYWNGQEWRLLGRASGLLTGPALPARPLSRALAWDLGWPLFGLEPDPWSWLRLLLHGGSAALAASIAARTGGGPGRQLTAGLLLAAAPLAFGPLYGAAGLQILLATCLALAAVERWLAGGVAGRLAALPLGLAAILSHEAALGLPFLLAALSGRGPGSRTGAAGDAADGPAAASPAARLLGWFVPLALLAGTILEFGLFREQLSGGPGRPWAYGPWYDSLRNLALYGWWLASPWPAFAGLRSPWPVLATGATVWLLWGWLARRAWARGSRLPAAALLGATLALLPLLPLAEAVRPGLAYPVAAAAALTLSGLLPRRWRPRRGSLLLMCGLALAWAWGGMAWRLAARDAAGLPADPLVRATALSYHAARTLDRLPLKAEGDQLVLLAPPVTDLQAEMADRLGPDWVPDSPLHRALSGAVGPRLLLPATVRVWWASNLAAAPPEAFVAADGGSRLLPWGRTPQALLYLTLEEVGRGRFVSARRHLLRAALLGDRRLPFLYDEGLLPGSAAPVRRRAAGFLEFLADTRAAGGSEIEAVGLRDLFRGMLRAMGPPAAPDTAGAR